jgi:hypothetical protein
MRKEREATMAALGVVDSLDRDWPPPCFLPTVVAGPS